MNSAQEHQEDLSKRDMLSRRRGLLPLASAVVLFVLFSGCPGSPGTVANAESTAIPGDKLHILSSAREAHNLSNEEAIQAFPAHLRGVITYFDPDFGTGFAAIFIHDATGNVFVSQTSKLAKGLFVGALVDVRGVSAPGGSALSLPTPDPGHRPRPSPRESAPRSQ